MNSFNFGGVEYRSCREFCLLHGLSCSRMKRLRAHYLRAQRDPAVAALWMLEPDAFRSEIENKTSAGALSRELTRLRVQDFRARHRRMAMKLRAQSSFAKCDKNHMKLV